MSEKEPKEFAPKFYLKDLVMTSIGRIGQVVGSIRQRGESTVFRVLWFDNLDEIADAQEDDLQCYWMPSRIISVD